MATTTGYYYYQLKDDYYFATNLNSALVRVTIWTMAWWENIRIGGGGGIGDGFCS